MSTKAFLRIVKKIANEKKVPMPNRWRNYVKPWTVGLGINCGLWAVSFVSVLHCWFEGNLSPTHYTYKLFGIVMHIACLILLCIIITNISYVVFHKNNFHSFCSTVGFVLYVLTEVIVIVNALIMIQDHHKFLVEAVTSFVLLTLYTQTISWHSRTYKDKVRTLHEAYIERMITSRHLLRGVGCYWIPLSGDFASTTSTESDNTTTTISSIDSTTVSGPDSRTDRGPDSSKGRGPDSSKGSAPDNGKGSDPDDKSEPEPGTSAYLLAIV